jgi:PhnB protein
VEVQTYLMFEGRCEEAIEFYRSGLGADVTAMSRFRDSPEPGAVPPGAGDKIMHAALRIGDTTVFASDGGQGTGQPVFRGFALSIAVSDEAAARRMFAALENGGKVVMPLQKTFWSPLFGMLTDRFGVSWMVSIAS